MHVYSLILFFLWLPAAAQQLIRPEQLKNPNQIRINTNDLRSGSLVSIWQIQQKPFINKEGNNCIPTWESIYYPEVTYTTWIADPNLGIISTSYTVSAHTVIISDALCTRH